MGRDYRRAQVARARVPPQSSRWCRAHRSCRSKGVPAQHRHAASAEQYPSRRTLQSLRSHIPHSAIRHQNGYPVVFACCIWRQNDIHPHRQLYLALVPHPGRLPPSPAQDIQACRRWSRRSFLLPPPIRRHARAATQRTRRTPGKKLCHPTPKKPTQAGTAEGDNGRGKGSLEVQGPLRDQTLAHYPTCQRTSGQPRGIECQSRRGRQVVASIWPEGVVRCPQRQAGRPTSFRIPVRKHFQPVVALIIRNLICFPDISAIHVIALVPSPFAFTCSSSFLHSFTHAATTRNGIFAAVISGVA